MKQTRRTNFSTDQILAVIHGGGDGQPTCFWANELVVLALEGDQRAELALRDFLKRGGDDEKYVAYWGLKGLQGKRPSTSLILEKFEENPQNKPFMVPPRPRREVV